MKTILKIEGMHCVHCQKRVEAALQAVPGVQRVKVHFKNGKATVEGGEELPPQALSAAVEAAGYRVEGIG